MTLSYKDIKTINTKDLQELFLSVEWDSGNYPEKLAQAIAGAHSVFTAWDGDNLVGLINVLSDGHMAAYVHYLLVRPEYQGRGVGKALISKVFDAYADVPTKVLIAYQAETGFYERCGFCSHQDKAPMFNTSMNV